MQLAPCLLIFSILASSAHITTAQPVYTNQVGIYAHNAHSIFVYDESAEAFLLLFPPNGKGKKLQLAAYIIKSNAWEIVDVHGPAFPAPKYGSSAGYYDPVHNVLMAQGRYRDQVWVYRHRKRD